MVQGKEGNERGVGHGERGGDAESEGRRRGQ